MTEAQIQLQNALTTTFLANLAFLSEYDNELYHRVDELSRMINNGSYQEKYILEFIEDNGDFDIYDLKNHTYLYDKKPKELNKYLVNQIDYTDKHSINSLEKALYNQKLKQFDEDDIKVKKYELQDTDDAEYILKYDVSKYLNVLKDSYARKKLRKVEKFIFLGTLLGRHINPIVKKINADLYFVCEKNLEIFRLSLFVNDYSHLAEKRGVIFSIMDNEELLRKKITQFLNLNPFSNYLIKLSSTNININEYIDAFLTSIVITKPTTFDYNRMLYTLMRNISEKVNNENFLQLEDFKNSILSDVKVLYIAGGPSFFENLEWIKKNQDKFFIVTIGAVYKCLILNEIRVDVVITLDSSYKVFKEKQFSNEDLKLLKNSIVIYSSMTDKRFVELFPENKFCYDVITSYYSKKEMFPATSVGEKGVEILLKLGVKELYLLGLDLALNQKTGDSHGKSTNSITQNYNLKDKDNINDRSIFGLNTGLIKVKGNFLDEVYITVMFKSAIECLNRITKNIDEDVSIYNLSEHGAFFENTIPLKINNLKVKQNERFNKNLLINSFKINSKKVLSEENEIHIINEINFLNNIFNNLDIYFAKEHRSYDIFYNDIIELIENLIYKNDKVSFSPYIFRNYFHIIISYLNFEFNSKLKQENKKIYEIKKIMKEQLHMLYEDYIKYLRNMIRPNKN